MALTCALVAGLAGPALAENPDPCPTDGTADPVLCPTSTGDAGSPTATATTAAPEPTATPADGTTSAPTAPPADGGTTPPVPTVTPSDPASTSGGPTGGASSDPTGTTSGTSTPSPAPVAPAPVAATATTPVPSAVAAVPGAARSFGYPVLAPPTAVGVSTLGWSNPAVGRLTSGFGMRVHPIFGIVSLHSGQDIAARCGAPVHAAAGGVVAWVGGSFQGRTGNQVVIANGNGIVTRYGHLLSGSVLVKYGQVVEPGQQIAAVGGDAGIDPSGAGLSTGCHLHFEVNEDDGMTPVNPVDFLAARGVGLGVDMPFVFTGPAAPAGPTLATSAADLDRIKAIVAARKPAAAVRPLG